MSGPEFFSLFPCSNFCVDAELSIAIQIIIVKN
jgi:hypothetical protein